MERCAAWNQDPTAREDAREGAAQGERTAIRFCEIMAARNHRTRPTAGTLGACVHPARTPRHTSPAFPRLAQTPPTAGIRCNGLLAINGDCNVSIRRYSLSSSAHCSRVRGRET